MLLFYMFNINISLQFLVCFTSEKIVEDKNIILVGLIKNHDVDQCHNDEASTSLMWPGSKFTIDTWITF